MGTEPVRLEGTVADVRTIPLSGTVRWTGIDGRKQERVVRSQGGFDLVVEGRRVRVHAGAAQLAGPTSDEDGALGDLLRRLEDREPAPQDPAFTKARLALLQVCAGDRAEIYGEVTQRDAAGAPVVVTARVVGLGRPGAAAIQAAMAADARELAKTAGASSGSVGGWLFAVLVAAGAVAWPLLHFEPMRVAVARSIALAAAAWMLRPAPDDLAFHVRDEELKELEIPMTPFQILLFVGALLLPFARQKLGPLYTGDVAAAGTALVMLLIVAVGTRVRRHARALVRGPAWTGAGARSAVVRGTVRAIKEVTVDGKPCVMGLSGHFESITKDHFTDRHEFLAGRFEIDTAHGPVALDAREVVWSSDVRWEWNRAPASHGDQFDYARVVQAGAEVVACGKLAVDGGDKPRLESRGTEPVYLSATAAGRDPLALPRGVVRFATSTTLVMLLALAAAIAHQLTT